MLLTSKQRAYLKALANTEEPIIQIGKDGISDGTIGLVDEALTARELIKIRVLKSVEEEPKELAYVLVDRLPGTELIQVLGRVILLFRANDKKPQIILP